MKIIYFDICSIPLFLILLFICYSRKMTRGNVNRLFITLLVISLISAFADLSMEIADNAVPLSEAGRTACEISTYIYLVLRNATNLVLLLFLLALTKTEFLLGKWWKKAVFLFPYLCIVGMLVQNPFTHTAFTVTAETGYGRGPLMNVFYGIALIYGLAGFAYCVYCRRYLTVNRWSALIGSYVLVHLAVLIQFLHPELLVEMFCTALTELLITTFIMRPEERMDIEAEMLSWASYQADLRNIVLSGEQVQIAVMRMGNSRQIRNYLGDHSYGVYLSEIANMIRLFHWKHPDRVEVYLERPGTIYLITDVDEPDMENLTERMLTESGEEIRRYEEAGVRFEPQICLIQCPDDLSKAEDIISLGHIFQKFDNGRGNVCRASEIINLPNYSVEVHIEEVLDRAVRENHIEIYYQPIYDVHTGYFHTAEALARIIDPVFGLISPGIFIPAAEKQGFILPVGDAVLEQTFRFLSEHNPNQLGLSSVEINLSVAQCMESSLPEKIRRLQQKYSVDPENICFEITETTFENFSDILLKNVNDLIRMGYSFALDDYGIGYSSIQRVNHLPLRLIKIDKSMLDEVSTRNGKMILEHTVQMMQSINKQLVTEGAETAENVELLKRMGCDYIQGFFFSRPLPEKEFIRFMETHRQPVMC